MNEQDKEYLNKQINDEIEIGSYIFSDEEKVYGTVIGIKKDKNNKIELLVIENDYGENEVLIINQEDIIH